MAEDKLVDGKPYEEEKNAVLNAASYAAMAMFGFRGHGGQGSSLRKATAQSGK